MKIFIRLLISLSCASALAGSPHTLPGTAPLEPENDRSTLMLDGIHRFSDRALESSPQGRARFWNRDTSSPAAYDRSVEPNRASLREILGVEDPRVPVRMERFGDEQAPALVAQNDQLQVHQVRWPVLEGVHGEGLLLEPKTPVRGHLILLPDADQTPEQLAGLSPGIPSASQLARLLASAGFQVLVPTLISRDITFSGNPEIAMTNQPHREWIYRQAFHMGRHVIGYEVQKVLAAVDWIESQSGKDAPIGVAGYGEGGLVAFYASACDPRIDASLVSGYFGPRERLWTEPLYRNVWGLLREFGDAEIASLIAPRALVVEYAPVPSVSGPPPVPPDRRGGAAVGSLETPAFTDVSREWQRLESLVPSSFQPRALISGPDGTPTPIFSPSAVNAWLDRLGTPAKLSPSATPLTDRRAHVSPQARQGRQVRELEAHVQNLLHHAPATRSRFFLDNTTLIRTLASRGARFHRYRIKENDPDVFRKEVEPLRQIFAEDVIGRISDPVLPPNPRSRRLYDLEKWTGYEVVLDVFPDVIAWGVLLVPKNIPPGEKRPVVVCQHGRNGLPKDTIEGDSPSYHNFAARLAERGFVTFAPHNLYRGEDRYRMLNRKGNPLKLSMFSFITEQHRQTLKWLGSLPFVDADRIAFYGLSYGGETAVRVPPLVEDYSLSICSGDFNDWARKVVSTDSDYSFMFTVEWEMPYFNMGSTFNYAELVYLMVPRPFMVERGHHDGVAPDEWVASEYARVRWVYDNLGLGDRTAIEFFNGGHTINGEGTFRFLHHHLNWPEPENAP